MTHHAAPTSEPPGQRTRRPGLGHVKFVIDSCRVSGGGTVVERVGGTWFAEDGYAGWRIGQPHAQTASKRSASHC